MMTALEDHATDPETLETFWLNPSPAQHVCNFGCRSRGKLVGLSPNVRGKDRLHAHTPTHVKLTSNHKFRLDLNHDGIKDFEVDDIASGSSAFLQIHPLQSGNALAPAITDCNPSVAVGALEAGVLI